MGKHSKKGRQHSKARGSSGNRNWLYLVFSATIVLVIGLGGLMIFGGGNSPAPAVSALLPSYITRAPLKVQEAYAYAAAHPETTNYIPCYCGCGTHSGHLSVNDCFVASQGADGPVVYDPHGSGCDMCVDIALITKRMVDNGSPLSAVKKAVVDKYSYLGPPTDTPPIPQ